ncbi:uncharacterized protein TNCV_2961121 [Trichonephila clavipes]|nr:uncharacterized protein TNCV_2961121 [Trichonephila clavipes]
MADLSANTPRNEPENEREEYNYIMLPRYTNERWREGIYSVVGVDVKKTDEKYIYERDLLSDDEELELFASKHLFNFQMEYVKEEGKRFQEIFKKLMAMEERRGAKRKKKKSSAAVFKIPLPPAKQVAKTSSSGRPLSSDTFPDPIETLRPRGDRAQGPVDKHTNKKAFAGFNKMDNVVSLAAVAQWLRYPTMAGMS